MTEKAAFRAEIKARTANLSLVYLADSDRDILQNVLALPEFQSAPRVFLYISFGREPDTRLLIEKCAALGKSVAAPTNLREGRMDFALLTRPLAELPPGYTASRNQRRKLRSSRPKRAILCLSRGCALTSRFSGSAAAAGITTAFWRLAPPLKPDYAAKLLW